MGSWGVGMQANDTALDVIDGGRNDEKYLHKHINKWLKPDKYGNGFKSILGLAEYCLDCDVPFSFIMIEKIKKAIKQAKDNSDCWIDQKERLAALQRFEDRLDGKKIDMRDVVIDNMGLIDKISVGNKNRKELKKMLVKVK